MIAVNKWDDMDKYSREQCVASLSRKLEFATWARQVFISALHGSGIGELMKAVNRAFGIRQKIGCTLSKLCWQAF